VQVIVPEQNAPSPEAVKVGSPKRKARAGSRPGRFPVDKAALRSLRLVAVAYSHVKSAWFPTREAYEAEIEVEQLAKEVIAALKKLGLRAKAYRVDRYFMAKLLVDQPNLVPNLVDTLRGSDALQTSIQGALELAGIPYPGVVQFAPGAATHHLSQGGNHANHRHHYRHRFKPTH
jgi:hypothetical protein